MRIDYQATGGRFPQAAIDHMDLARRWILGESLQQIRDGMKLQVSLQTIHRRVGLLGLPRRLRSSAGIPQSEIVRAYQCGMPTQAISDRLGVSRRQILRILHLRKVELRHCGMAPSERRRQRSEAVRLWRAGFTMRQIAKALGMTYEQARGRVRAVLGPQPNGHGPSVSLERIQQLAASGRSHGQIARIVGLKRQTIGRRLQRAARRSA